MTSRTLLFLVLLLPAGCKPRHGAQGPGSSVKAAHTTDAIGMIATPDERNAIHAKQDAKLSGWFAQGLFPANEGFLPPVPSEELTNAGVTIENFSYEGNGCPDQTVGYTVNETKTAIAVLFDQLNAELPPTDLNPADPPGQDTEDNGRCRMEFTLQINSGYQITLIATETNGYVYLDQGLNAVQSNTYYFADNQTQQTRYQSTWTASDAPVDTEFSFPDVIAPGTASNPGLEQARASALNPATKNTMPSTCATERVLNIEAELKVNYIGGSSNGGMGFLAVDNLTTEVTGGPTGNGCARSVKGDKSLCGSVSHNLPDHTNMFFVVRKMDQACDTKIFLPIIQK